MASYSRIALYYLVLVTAKYHWHGVSQTCLSDEMLVKNILGLHFRPVESESLGMTQLSYFLRILELKEGMLNLASQVFSNFL